MHSVARTSSHTQWGSDIEPVLEITRGDEVTAAYALASVAADLQVSEVVDAPNWVVAAVLPLDYLEQR